MSEIMQAAFRGDRHKSPRLVPYRMMTYEDMAQLTSGMHIHMLDMAGKIARVKITSVKRWVRRPRDLRINLQFGLYEFFSVDVVDGVCRDPLIVFV